MTNNLNKFGAQGSRYTFWALWDSGSPNYIAGTDGSLAAGEDSGMGRLLGMTSMSAAPPEAASISRQGDNGNLGIMLSNPVDGPAGNFAFGSFDQTFDTSVLTRTIVAEGPHDISLMSNRCFKFAPVFIVVNSPASSDESGSLGENGWQVEEYLYVMAQPLSVSEKALNTAHSYTHRLVFGERDRLPWGEQIASGTWGISSAWKTDPYWSALPVFYHTYVGDGTSEQTFTLDKIPASADGDHLQIWDAGTKLEYTTDFTVDTSGVVSFVGTDPGDGNFAVAKVLFDPGC